MAGSREFKAGCRNSKNAIAAVPILLGEGGQTMKAKAISRDKKMAQAAHRQLHRQLAVDLAVRKSYLLR
jgi:hypothetical protein